MISMQHYTHHYRTTPSQTHKSPTRGGIKLSADGINIIINVTSPPEPGRAISNISSANPASAMVGKPTSRAQRVPPACMAHSPARRRTTDPLRVVGHEQAGGA